MTEDNYSISDVRKIAGEDLTDRMLDVFEDETKVVNWFYSSNKALGVSPSEYCIEGKSSEIEKILGRIEHGIF